MDNKYQSSTVKTYLSVLRAILAESQIKLKEDQFLLSSLTRACKIKNDMLITQLPIGKGMLNILLLETNKLFPATNSLRAHHNDQGCMQKLYKAILVLGYYGLLRVGELTKSPHVILTKNVHMGTIKSKILFIMNSSKTHDERNKLQMVKISYKPLALEQKTKIVNLVLDHNPFILINDYIEVRPLTLNAKEQFFIFADNSAVRLEQLRTVLRTLITNMGLQAHLYNVHSLRIGRTGDLMKLSLSVETIKKIGRWRSNAVFTYLPN